MEKKRATRNIVKPDHQQWPNPNRKYQLNEPLRAPTQVQEVPAAQFE
jgi:hypothetical protein